MQNRLSRAAPRLPSAVTQQGVRVDKARSNFLLFAILSSDDPAWTRWRWATTPRATCCPKSSACPASARRSCSAPSAPCASGSTRPSCVGFNLTAADVTAAIRAQNAQVSAGEIGDLPNVAGQGIAATVVVNGQLSSVEQFGNIVLRANADGSTVRLKDVARIELGAQTYATSARLNGKPSTGIGVQLSPTGNALATAKAVRTTHARAGTLLPARA